MNKTNRSLWAAGCVVAWTVASGATARAAAVTVEIYAAGSLRGVVGELAKEAGPLLHVRVQPTFGGSGSLRQRIEKGASPDLFLSNQIDVSITYCSGAAGLLRQVPQLTSFVVPPRLDPHPLYGMAILSARPEPLRLALYLLSQKGQVIIAREGLVPIR